MGNRFDFVSPGAAATDELTKILAQREAQRRQAMLDQITQRNADRTDEIQRANLDILKDQKGQALEKAKQDSAAQLLTVAGNKPGTETSQMAPAVRDAAQVFGLIQPPKSNVRDVPVEQPAGSLVPGLMGVQEQGTVTPETYAGTGEQRKTADADALHKALGQKLSGVTDRKEATRIAAEMGVPYAQIDDVVNAFMGPKASAPAGVAGEFLFSKGMPADTVLTPELQKEFEKYQTDDANRKKPVIPPSTDGGFSPKQVVTFNNIASAYERSPLIRASDRTVTLKSAAAAIDKNPSDPANQLALAYGWIQALDTYQSAVREGELQLAGSIATRFERLQMEANRIVTQGAILPPETAKLIAANAKELIRAIETGKKAKQKAFASRAKVSGVGKMWDEFVGEAGNSSEEPAPTPAPAPLTTAAPASTSVVKWGRDASGKPVRLQ